MSDKTKDIQQAILNARRDSRYETETGGPPTWLVSFTDVIALMLTFFVLLFSMMAPEPQKWERKVGVTMNNYGDFQGDMGKGGAQEGVSISREDMNLAQDLEYLEALFNEIILDRKMTNIVNVSGHGGRLSLNFSPSLHLNNKNFVIFLNQLEPVLESLDNQIILVGREDGDFDMLQKLGRMIQNNGYQRPLSIKIQNFENTPLDAQFILSIESHDGRRIVR